MNLPKILKNKIKKAVPLGPRTTFRIGGKSQYWYEPRDKQELAFFLKEAAGALPFFVIGSGSNLLVKDGVIKKIFIHLSSDDFKKIQINGTSVVVGAGMKISRFLAGLKSRDLGGYEFLAGIPGTIGGALVMNAGAKSEFSLPNSWREMKDIVSEVEVLDKKGSLFVLRKEKIKFSYRYSSLKPYIIVSAKLKLQTAPRRKVQETIARIVRNRLKYQDWRYPSAGSFFRNPGRNESAGRLIDLCQLKGLTVGGAQVSCKHANFIVNTGRAKSRDVLKLMEIVTKKVYNHFRIKLIPEVEIVS
jgi:UDP-N-acetylmuramate dehydrogenase